MKGGPVEVPAGPARRLLLRLPPPRGGHRRQPKPPSPSDGVRRRGLSTPWERVSWRRACGTSATSRRTRASAERVKGWLRLGAPWYRPSSSVAQQREAFGRDAASTADVAQGEADETRRSALPRTRSRPALCTLDQSYARRPSAPVRSREVAEMGLPGARTPVAAVAAANGADTPHPP